MVPGFACAGWGPYLASGRMRAQRISSRPRQARPPKYGKSLSKNPVSNGIWFVRSGGHSGWGRVECHEPGCQHLLKNDVARRRRQWFSLHRQREPHRRRTSNAGIGRVCFRSIVSMLLILRHVRVMRWRCECGRRGGAGRQHRPGDEREQQDETPQGHCRPIDSGTVSRQSQDRCTACRFSSVSPVARSP